ncbi:MAG: glycine cleavage system protein R [Candidatus Sedimenticola endophacoides]|uniref:Glycine cleavage system transcriptional repressor n=1 Tax=Candidatus Sedimenticola endophacoides TaxID=2548426 RepID=A0A657Q5B5_9GAMM|nr:MAG: glycine cleavage system protein R [Candidatus Sedimenticola endophacoides]OQX34342.1 MAG: glycine cleavage system protein R [Candidatus Sedimenticola endophacoides]OQX42006.1 MAG: glycine cleavage system protein R [Candidatus Sedimenticola endophacoides]OQX43223.1 MAG: glycine cleavage system protein R [Candidatus Sedimenticola endophacoides]OQX44055.1 MAG: glycine cleavage system protein R [Candidatus Sedimenticola endophacoides]
MPNNKNYLVISALGKDRPGIVNALSKAILEEGCNIADSRMTVLGGEFAILLMVEGNWNTLSRLEQNLPQIEAQLELTIISKRTEGRTGGLELLPYAVEVVALDHPGIVHHLASFFSSRDINIEDLITTSYAAAHTGTPMFSVSMTVGIPADLHIATLRDEFLEFCDSMNLDAVLEPLKG